MMEDNSENFRYVAMFDSLGFESIIDITYDELSRVESVLNDEKDPLNDIQSLISKMSLRARMNSHRNPEIWIFWSDVDENTLVYMAKQSPQIMADLIRSKGVSVFKSGTSENVIK